MIVAKTILPAEEDFIKFGNEVSLKVQNFLLSSESVDSYKTGESFETLVFEISKQCANGTVFDGNIRRTNDRDFPDIIVCGYYGIEVKVTKKNDWTSIGNSVLESSRIEGVEKIYILFGKLGGRKPEVKFRKYQDCLNGISVTHWPRYQIDMELKNGHSIFNKMKVKYEIIRQSDNPIKFIRPYYQSKLKNGESLWWIDDSHIEEMGLSPIIKNLKEMTGEEKKNVLTELFVLFPEVFSNSLNKFEAIPSYLASKYGIVTSNLRDFFSAGGQVEITHNNVKYIVPRIVSKMLELADSIHNYFNLTHQDEKTWLRKAARYISCVPIIEMYNNKIK